MPMEAGAIGIRPVNQPQRTGTTDGIQRKEDGGSGSGFKPQTNVAIKTAIDDMAGVLSKISTNEKLNMERLPDEVSQVVKNVLQQAFSMESTLSQGIGSTLESQRFSMEQLSVFARMLSQIGALAEKGFSMELSDQMELLLKNFKSLIISEEGGSALEPVLLSKAAFELIDSKTAEQLPQQLYAILSALSASSADQTSTSTAQESDSMGFLKQLVKYFMPRPAETGQSSNAEGKDQGQLQRQAAQSQARQFLQSMFGNLRAQQSAGQQTNQSQQQQQANQSQAQMQNQGQFQQVNQQGQSGQQPQATNQQGQSQTLNQPQSPMQEQTQPQQMNQQPQAQNQQGQSQVANQSQQMSQAQTQPQMQNQGQFQQVNQQGQSGQQPQATNQQGQSQTLNQPQSPMQEQTQPQQMNQQPQAQNQQGQQQAFNQTQPQMQNQGKFQQINQQGQPNQQSQVMNQSQSQIQEQGQPLQANQTQQPYQQAQQTSQQQQGQTAQPQQDFNNPNSLQGQQQLFSQKLQAQLDRLEQGDDFLVRQQQLKADLQAAKTVLLKQPLQNTPQTMDTMQDIAQLLMRNQNITERDTNTLQNFINNNQDHLTEGEARHLQNLLRLCQQNVPITVQQAAVQQKLPDLPRLWAFMQLCDMAPLTSKLSAKAFKRAGRDVAEFANAMRQSMGGENSSVQNAAQNNRSLQMMMPLYVGDNDSSYPTYLHVYDENAKDKDTGEDKKETWLRICVLTDYIGAVELTFRMYENNQLDMRFYFSERSVANEFRTYIPSLKEKLKDTELNVGEVRIGSVGEKMLSEA
ncbi:MAG: hypothetical protein IJ862_04495 [Selenomonadaceae bacterium]|nr:hypothetical protein [Selenomonadaceae bacterium]